MSAALPEKAKIVIVGAGAIGGLLGVHLSLRGHAVTFMARGAHLAAMREAHALKLIKPDGTTVQSAPTSHFVSSLQECDGIQHVIILGLKMHQIHSVVDDLPLVIGPQSVIVTTQNGIPWWYFQHYGGPEQFRDQVVETVDPGGVLKARIDATKLLATVVYPAGFITQPGTVRHVEGMRFPIGELSGVQTSTRVQWMAAMLVDAGFKSPVLSDVRSELWLKLWGTVAVNPLSALTHASLDVLCAKGGPGRVAVVAVMREVEAVARSLGSRMRLPMEKRIDGAARITGHRTSMLQDVEAGRELEIGAIIGSVVELARLCGEETPVMDAIFGTICLLRQVMRTEKAKVCLVPIAES